MKLKIASTVRLFALAVSIAGAATLSAAKVESLKIQQEGENKIPQEMLNISMRLRQGSEYSREYLDEDIKNLYASGKIADVTANVENLANGNVAIVLKVKPSPVITVLKIEGNAKFETKDLQKHFTINEGDRLNSRQLNETLENLRKFYIEKGYSDVRIAPPTVIPDGKNGGIVTVKITENLRLKVNSVHFDKVTVYSERALKKHLYNNYSYWTLLPFINNFLNYGLLNRGELELDKARLRDLYHDLGYLDFKVNEIVLTPKPDDAEFVDVLYKVEEGKPYTVDRLTISGNQKIDSKELMPLIKLLSGKTFSRLDEVATSKAISEVYDSRGYTDMTVRPVRTVDFKEKKVSVDFKISEGRKFRVNEIVIIGNTETRHKVLLREMALQPGDPVAKHRINISRQRLLGMGYFKNVEVEAVNSEDLDAKDIHVKVEEKPDRFNFRVGAGASDINSFFGMAEISSDNFDIANPRNWFYGGGQRLRLQGIYGIDNAGFNFDFKDITAEKAIAMMPAVDTIMPLLKSFAGKINCEIAATSRLDTNMNILTPTINGILRISGYDLSIKDSDIFTSLAKKLHFNNSKVGNIQHMTVEGVIQDNVLEVFPFVLSLDRYTLALSGKQNLDMSYKYHASVIRSPMLLKVGVDIYGKDFDNMKFKIGKPKYRNTEVPVFTAVIDETKINLAESIRGIFEKGVEIAVRENERQEAINEHKARIGYVNAAEQQIEELTAEEQKQLEEERIKADEVLPVDSLSISNALNEMIMNKNR